MSEAIGSLVEYLHIKSNTVNEVTQFTNIYSVSISWSFIFLVAISKTSRSQETEIKGEPHISWF